MSSDAKTTTEEIPLTTTGAPEPEDNASGDQGAKKVAVENDAVMNDKPPAVPEEIDTAKTSDAVPTDDAEGETPKDKETVPTVPDEAAAEPLAVADGDKDQMQPSDEGDGPKGDAAIDVADKPSDGDGKAEKTTVDKETEVAPSDAADSEKPATTTKEGESEAALVVPSDAADSEKPATTTKEGESEAALVAPSDAADSEKPATTTKESESEVAPVAQSDSADSEKRATTTTEGESPPSPPKKQKMGDAKTDGAPEAALAAGVVAKQAPASPSA